MYEAKKWVRGFYFKLHISGSDTVQDDSIQDRVLNSSNSFLCFTLKIRYLPAVLATEQEKV